MKRTSTIICATAVMLLIAACGGKHQFNVAGTVADDQFNGKTAYLYNGETVMDSTVVADHTFSFSGEVTEPWMGTVAVMSEAGRALLTFVVEPGNISLDLLEDRLSGTPMNDSLYAFMQLSNNTELRNEMNTYLQLYYGTSDPAVRADAERKYDSVEAIANQLAFEQAMQLYNNNKDNLVGAYALGTAAQLDKLSYAELHSLLEQAAPVVRNYQPLVSKLSQLKAIEETSAGRHYTDIQGVDGKLSDLIDGHLALVDFYASWCGPCRNEIRDNLVPLWAKYKDKGLVIVGLNVWERGDRTKREAAHQKVMTDLGITYPQLVDSTRTATDTYGVRGIPQIMLIAPDGTILARDLRGAAIEEAIVKALGK